MKYSKNDIFFISSSCKLVKGANRSVIIDYPRADVQIISNQFYDLLQLMDRKKIQETLDHIEEDSLDKFYDFLDFLLENEYGFITSNIDSFPEISTIFDDAHVTVKDIIVEIDEQLFLEDDFTDIIHQIDALGCSDLQLRILSPSNYSFLNKILAIADASNLTYLELLVQEVREDISNNQWHKLFENYSSLSSVNVYNSDENKSIEFFIERNRFHSLAIGKLNYLEESSISDCCGIITFDHLTFNDTSTHHLHQKFNGCLYKKLAIDKYGNIKNCPSMEKTYGHINNISIHNAYKSEGFRNLWTVNKDIISVCKDCEFRYNCSDCRAFTSDKDDIHSKPLKCGYNPYTNTWEDWSLNELKTYEAKKYGFKEVN
ncbi:grasp-with-spasm system SPASM domain peptide maturase [Sinomicrobium sp. M5D2P9]